MNETNINDNNYEKPLTIDFSKIVVPTENYSDVIVGNKVNDSNSGAYTIQSGFANDIVGHIQEGKVNFGSIASAYAKDSAKWNVNTENDSWQETKATIINDPYSNVTYINPSNINTNGKVQGAGNVFANTPATNTKSSATELQRIVQKLEKLEKMINPNSKKSLILWEEDNSFKNLISSIVSYANNCNTTDEFPIELFDRLKALGEDVDKQIAEGKEKIIELEAQAKANTALGDILSQAYISATAGLSREEYEANMNSPEIEECKEYLATISSCEPNSEEYEKAEKAIKSKISNLENSVHVTIDLERTVSKGGALNYIKTEVTPAIARLEEEYIKFNNAGAATTIDGEEAITALTVKKSFVEKVYDTFVRPIANLFKRKNKVK